MRWNMNRGSERVSDAIVELFRSASGRTIFLGPAFLVADPLAKAVGGNILGTSKPELVL